MWIRRCLIAAMVAMTSIACGANSTASTPVENPDEVLGIAEDRSTSTESTDTTGTTQATLDSADLLQAEPEYLCSEPTTPLESVRVYPLVDPPMVELEGTRAHMIPLFELDGDGLPDTMVKVGDHDGDGIQDLVDVTEDQTLLYSGASFPAEDGGADGRSVAPLLMLPGLAMGTVDVGQDAPALVVAATLDSDPPVGVLSIVDERGIRRFSTAGLRLVDDYLDRSSGVQVIEADSGLFLELSNTSRSGSRRYRWRIDSPCPG